MELSRTSSDARQRKHSSRRGGSAHRPLTYQSPPVLFVEKGKDNLQGLDINDAPGGTVRCADKEFGQAISAALGCLNPAVLRTATWKRHVAKAKLTLPPCFRVMLPTHKAKYRLARHRHTPLGQTAMAGAASSEGVVWELLLSALVEESEDLQSCSCLGTADAATLCEDLRLVSREDVQSRACCHAQRQLRLPPSMDRNSAATCETQNG